MSGTDSGERGEWNLAAQVNNLDEFLKRVESFIDRSSVSGLIRRLAHYRSLEFSCMAARSGPEWILIAGGAILSSDPRASNSSISPVFHNNGLVALYGRVSAADLADLVNYLKDSVVPTGNTGYNIRLMPEGAGEWVWQGPVVRPVDKSSYPWKKWKNEIALHGSGANISSLVAPWRHQIDDQLLRATPPYKGFSGLCRKVRIPTTLESVRHSFFNISAELPAQFVSVDDNRKRGAVDVDFECVGTPSLMRQWLPEGDLDRVDWRYDSTADRHHVSIECPPGSTELDLMLHFNGLGQADTLRYRVSRDSTLLRIAEYFDPRQARLQAYLNEKTNPDANPFELGVARLLSTGGFVVQWFGKASKEAMPDIVAYWRSPPGEEHVVLAECTMRDPTAKLTDLIHRRKLMSEATGIALAAVLPVLFLRTAATDPDFRAAGERGVALCDEGKLAKLRDQVMSGGTPSEIYATLRAWAHKGYPGGAVAVF